MKVLLIGSGGREHALAKALAAAPSVSSVAVAPGNAGTAQYNVDLVVDDHDAVVDWCQEQAVDLVVVGPEVPLVAGIADRLAGAGVACFGPSAAAAQLEGSKAFARDFAVRFGIPSPAWRVFRSSDDAIAWLDDFGAPVVVKADGLAAGKGVVVPESRDETVAAIRSMLDDHTMGESGASVVLEERMYGEELSLFGIADGSTVATIATAQDHKRVGEGDTGPNTGGMGAFSPVPGIDPARQAELAELFLEPVVRGMNELGTPYRGVIFAGLMLTAEGPKLVEYNCRFGDPEAEAILPRLEGDVAQLLAAAAHGRLDPDAIALSNDVTGTVVVAADGYPASPRRGVPIDLPQTDDTVTVFHAGTSRDDGGRLVSSGGRVLAVTGRGADLDEALDAAYGVVDQIVGDGLFARSDIGWRHRSSSQEATS